MGDSTSYIVTVTGVSGSGILGLNLVDPVNVPNESPITNASGTPAGNFTGQVVAVGISLYWDGDASNPSDGGSGQWLGGATWRQGSPTGPLCPWINARRHDFPMGRAR